ncbi:MAG: bifunctional DNA-formamidopyrimidine glycosylase/DNA-(apurinic or apyrimidinic site) lyase [Armatimonadaceae bacterium]
MPELPEVETLRRGLQQSVTGSTVTAVCVTNPKVLKEQPESVFKERIVGSQFGRIDRRGKYILATLNNSDNTTAESIGENRQNHVQHNPFTTLCIHLKMRGQLRLERAEQTAGPYLCISLSLDNGTELRFYDMWTWGEMRALNTAELRSVKALAQMGPEPLEPEWDAACLRSRLTNRKIAVKTALLDQTVVAGVGNIYADESLFRAGIHPQRPATSLTVEEAERLAGAIRDVLSAAVEHGGTTSEEFVDLAGSIGRFAPLVYDKGGEPCVRCASPLTRIKLNGRGTVFCAQCQPLLQMI